MFDHKHYVPILKSKAGERWALRNIAQANRQHVTPLLEIHEHDRDDVETHCDKLFDDLREGWGTNNVLFIDPTWLYPSRAGDAGIITTVFDVARSHGLQAIPVAYLTFSAATLGAISSIAQQDGRGTMLRLPAENAGSSFAIQGVVQQLGVTTPNVDLLLDYQASAMALTSDVPQLPSIMDWRSLTSASGTFPASVRQLQIGQWHALPRYDWNGWELEVSSAVLPRRPAFADYLIRDPGEPLSFGQPSAKLAYTLADHWLMRVGGKVNQGRSSDMYDICNSLINRADYSGQGFSAGDDIIYQKGQGTGGPGNPQNWLEWSMNHHIQYVVDQIINHAGL